MRAELEAWYRSGKEKGPQDHTHTGTLDVTIVQIGYNQSEWLGRCRDAYVVILEYIHPRTQRSDVGEHSHSNTTTHTHIL